MKTAAALPVTILLLLLTSGCDLDELLEPDSLPEPSPYCTITEVTTVDAEWGQYAKVIMTAQNTGNDPAYGVCCEVKLKTGNTILERSRIWFGDLEPGESAVGEAWFSSITSHSQYERLEYKLEWF